MEEDDFQIGEYKETVIVENAHRWTFKLYMTIYEMSIRGLNGIKGR